MLGEHPITPCCWPSTSPQPGSSNRGQLGLQIIREDENAIVLRVRQRQPPGRGQQHCRDAGQQTQAAWQVSDIRTEMAELHTRGITVEDFDTRGQRRSPGGRAGLDSHSCSRDARHRP